MKYKNVNTVAQILSFFFKYTLERKKGKWSENVTLCLNKGTMELSTENAIYSFGKNYYAFADAYNKLNIKKYPINNVLILGMGMGSIVEILEKYFDKLDFTGIEADNVIVDLYNKYIQPKKGFNVNVIEHDAYEFVKDNTNQYDMINIDIFIDDVIPHPFHDHTFLENIKNSLSPKGIVLFNRLDSKAAYRQYNKQYWEKVFSSVFKNSQSLKIRGNLVLVGFNSPS